MPALLSELSQRERLLFLADEMLDSQRYAEAAKAYTKLLELTPPSADPAEREATAYRVLDRAACYSSMKKDGKARADTTLACKYAPADAFLLFARAIVCSNSKRPAEAESDCAKALKLVHEEMEVCGGDAKRAKLARSIAARVKDLLSVMATARCGADPQAAPRVPPARSWHRDELYQGTPEWQAWLVDGLTLLTLPLTATVMCYSWQSNEGWRPSLAIIPVMMLAKQLIAMT